MAQLYYEPKYSPLDIIRLGAQLYGLKRGLDLQKGAQDVARQKNAIAQAKLEAEYGKDMQVQPGSQYATGQTMSNLPMGGVGVQGHIPGYKERELAIKEQSVNIQSRLASLKGAEERRQQMTYKTQWQNFMENKPDPTRLMALSQIDAFKPSVNLLLDKIDAKELKTRWDAYNFLKSNEAVFLQTTKQTLRSDIEKAQKAGKLDEVYRLSKVYDATGPGMLEDFFGFPKDERPEAQKMGMAATLASGTSTEERLLLGQELISIRQEKRDLQRQIADLERMKSVGILEDESVLTSAKQQLKTLRETEQDLLGKKPKEASKPTLKGGQKDYSHLWK